MKKPLALLLVLCTLFSLIGCFTAVKLSDLSEGIEQSQDKDYSEKEAYEKKEEAKKDAASKLAENGTYTAARDVARYIHEYGKLPGNFITKTEARALGWEGGSVEKYAPGKCIGGDRFGNYEELLPTKQGRTYKECDIDTLGKNSRGAKRIVFSNDGLIFYTDDHYESFVQLYDEKGQVSQE